ncbi:MAG: hypothetical protein AABO57_28010 [Acidobacteriota bacterium]
MKTEENIKNDEQATIEEKPEEKSEGGLKINTNVKAGGVLISD